MTKDEIKEKLKERRTMLISLRAELEARLAVVAAAEVALRDAERSVAELRGTYKSHGIIREVEQDIAKLEDALRYMRETRVVFADADTHDPCIVVGVSANRIIVRDVKYKNRLLYHKDGTPVSRHNRPIDVTKTFPNGIDNWKPH